MSSPVAVAKQICDAVALELGKLQLATPINAKSQNVPRYDRAQLDQLAVSVAPLKRRNNVATRNGIKPVTYIIGLGVFKAIATFEEAETDPLVLLCEQIGEHFVSPPFQAAIDTGATMTCTDSNQGDDETPLFDVAKLDELFQFKALIQLTFQGAR